MLINFSKDTSLVQTADNLEDKIKNYPGSFDALEK